MAFWNREKISYEKLNQMVDEAMDGSFSEESYTESELSKLESKWARFLASSSLAGRQLQEEKEKIQELITDISHQTKTPLSGILLYTQLLQEEDLPPSALPLVQEIARQARRLDFLIHALLKTSRLETGVFQLAPVRQLLFPLLSEARDELASRAALKEIEILLPASSGEAACFDLKWTKEALCNLLDNAIKYSPEGSRITLSLRSFEMFCAIDVSDEGHGDFPGGASKALRPLFPGKGSRRDGGRGNRPLSLPGNSLPPGRLSDSRAQLRLRKHLLYVSSKVRSAAPNSFRTVRFRKEPGKISLIS